MGCFSVWPDLRTSKDWDKVHVIRAVFGEKAASHLLPLSHEGNFTGTSIRLAINKLGLKFNGLLSDPGKITSGRVSKRISLYFYKKHRDKYFSSILEGTPSIQLVLFVNNRLVDCASMKKAVEAAYVTLLPHRAAQLYVGQMRPTSSTASSNASLFVYLSLEMPASSLDVNVHPTKVEVHFLNEVCPILWLTV